MPPPQSTPTKKGATAAAVLRDGTNLLADVAADSPASNESSVGSEDRLTFKKLYPRLRAEGWTHCEEEEGSPLVAVQPTAQHQYASRRVDRSNQVDSTSTRGRVLHPGESSDEEDEWRQSSFASNDSAGVPELLECGSVPPALNPGEWGQYPRELEPAFLYEHEYPENWLVYHPVLRVVPRQ